MGVSINGGTPKSSISRWIFPYKPSILGYPYFRKPTYQLYHKFDCLSPRFYSLNPKSCWLSHHGHHLFFSPELPCIADILSLQTLACCFDVGWIRKRVGGLELPPKGHAAEVPGRCQIGSQGKNICATSSHFVSDVSISTKVHHGSRKRLDLYALYLFRSPCLDWIYPICRWRSRRPAQGAKLIWGWQISILCLIGCYRKSPHQQNNPNQCENNHV